MEIAKLVLEYVKVLAWPLVVVSVLIGFRRPLKVLLARVLQVQAGPVTATFNEAVKEAEEVAAARQGASGRRSAAATGEVQRFAPTDFRMAKDFGAAYRAGDQVLLDLTRMGDADAKRLIDFCAGMIFTAGGAIERITSKVFLLSHPAVQPPEDSVPTDADATRQEASSDV